ncbi:hypothetical protein ABT237_01660 [Streptomyces sp. NPDC001581]|uniref:hypothetical protein n=1 Tax=Streptomyces sp. NPDC001581 TaxID=3154386 RepID=UPI003318F950
MVRARQLASGSESIAPGRAANRLHMHADFPDEWDARDADEFYRATVTDRLDTDEVTRAWAPRYGSSGPSAARASSTRWCRVRCWIP